MDINHASEIDEIFDAISYRKGASVIRMLQGYLGAECFQVDLFSLGSISVTLVTALIFLKPFGVYILVSSNICSLGFCNELESNKPKALSQEVFFTKLVDLYR